jgi:hypothetical protein
MGPSYYNKYSNLRAGQDIYSGLTTAGQARLSQLIADCSQARSIGVNQEKEKAFLTKLRDWKGVTAANAQELRRKSLSLEVVGGNDDEEAQVEEVEEDLEALFDGDF